MSRLICIKDHTGVSSGIRGLKFGQRFYVHRDLDKVNFKGALVIICICA